jgi:hypothetical protein
MTKEYTCILVLCCVLLFISLFFYVYAIFNEIVSYLDTLFQIQ